MTGAEVVRIRIPYGEEWRSAAVPGERLLFDGELEELPELADFEAALRAQLAAPIGSPPLHELAAGRKNALILVEDATRQTPVARILPVLLAELNAAGLADERIEILTAPGTHRVLTEAEIEAKVGAAICHRLTISQHDFNDTDALVELDPVVANGVTIPVLVNRKVLGADLVIGLGNILPHCGAGFSAGAKILQPGVCGFATTSATHIAVTLLPEIPLGDIASPARAGIEEVGRRAGLDFIINTVRDPRGRVLSVVAGDQVAAHRVGVEVSRRAYAARVPEPADVVVASSYPADIDWWQAEKGLIAACFAVKPGGVIVLVTPCPEGLEHNHPLLRDWLSLSYAEGCARVAGLDSADTSADLIAADLAVDNAKIREKATILIVSDGLDDADVALLGYERCPDLQAAVARALELRPGATVGVLPYGGDCLPSVGRSPRSVAGGGCCPPARCTSAVVNPQR